MLYKDDTVFLSHLYLSISKKGRKRTHIIILQTPLAIELHKYIPTFLLMHLRSTFRSFFWILDMTFF